MALKRPHMELSDVVQLTKKRTIDQENIFQTQTNFGSFLHQQPTPVSSTRTVLAQSATETPTEKVPKQQFMTTAINSASGSSLCNASSSCAICLRGSLPQATCERCSRSVCHICSRTCDDCFGTFCTFCSFINYRYRFDRIQCFECEDSANAD